MGRRWTEDEVIYLEYFLYDPDKTYEEVAKFLNRTPQQIAWKSHELRRNDSNLGTLKNHYSEKEVEYIKNNYKKTPVKEISERLNRSIDAIEIKARSMGLKKNVSIRDYHNEILRLADKGLWRAEIARLLGIKSVSLNTYLRANDITVQYAPKEVTRKHFDELETIRIDEVKSRNVRQNK